MIRKNFSFYGKKFEHFRAVATIFDLIIFLAIYRLLKKLAAIGLLLIMFSSQFGYYLVMRHIQNEWKHKMKMEVISQLKDSELTLISYTDNISKIYWEEEEGDEEFRFNGEMYDLVRKKTINGKIFLYCINDHKEQQLVDHYNLITKHNSASGKKAKLTINNSITLFCSVPGQAAIHTPLKFLKRFHHLSDRFSSVVTQITSPPPKAC